MSTVVKPRAVSFESNLQFVAVSNTVTLCLYSVDMSLVNSNTDISPVIINLSNNVEGENLICPVTNIIGMNDGIIHIKSDDPTLQGTEVTTHNIESIYIEVL